MIPRNLDNDRIFSTYFVRCWRVPQRTTCQTQTPSVRKMRKCEYIPTISVSFAPACLIVTPAPKSNRPELKK
ncbi:hypothetical protein BB8028_0007g01660 [Beauveria bassiana]|uniref:Uncharacterized protein n=1 Tax=Beauveria bassiana TaxID=176275 RepID=A0A2S7YLA5_BEABA|nr:hypothetical protein BB8028_0007g01660 [Beauveria bassiana]